MLGSIVVFVFMLNCVLCQDGMVLIGDAVEAFNPCDEYVLTMERIIGGPPNL